MVKKEGNIILRKGKYLPTPTPTRNVQALKERVEDKEEEIQEEINLLRRREK